MSDESKKAPRKRSKLKIFVAFFLLIAVLGAGALFYWIKMPAAPASQTPVLFTVNKGSGVGKIARDLRQAGLLHNEYAFIISTYLQKNNGLLKAGEYSIKPGFSAWELALILEEGRTNLHPVVLPEGFNMRQIIARLALPLERPGDGRVVHLVNQREAWTLVNDASFVRSLGIEAPTLEGYLFPDTYFFSLEDNQTPEIINRMVAHFNQVWDSMPPYQGRVPLTRHQIMTLASIIEKETGVEGERPLVSAVYHNRLLTGMPLQADPTVVYGIETNGRPITLSQLRNDHAYNTYTRPGLPPGPICSPGKASIMAAMAPAAVDYLYFVATGAPDGSHNFANNLKDHQRNVAIYRANRR